MRDLTWMDTALCAQTDPDLFHPEGQGAKYRDAKKICGRCPVQPECTAHARHLEGSVGINDRHGMWAAQVPNQRVQAAGSEAA
jgi:hypothetical protein